MNWQSEGLIELCYIVASVLFIFGLKMLGKPTTARRGNLLSAVGMLLAIVATLLYKEVVSFKWIVIGSMIGALAGGVSAYAVKMTSMPEMVALFNGFGGLASLLVGWSEYHRQWVLNPGTQANPLFTIVAIFFTLLIGGVTFSGSLVAYAKLAEKITGKPILFKNQHLANGGLLLLLLVAGILLCLKPGVAGIYLVLLLIVALSLVLGVLSVIPIGGADMPVVISLLNSYSGMAACAAGFVIFNNVLIVAGALVGASGIILTNIMCKAMNRSLANVLFSGFGSGSGAASEGYKGEAKAITAEDCYLVLEAAQSVVFVPGYGMAVAQAQHAVRELGELLEKNGAEVKYAIHPVAGRMPGHMNVLLAEANVPYEQLSDLELNSEMDQCDAALVIGANDVVNPDARRPDSQIAGMPIFDVDKARTVMVCKRSLNPGFAGIENPLFFNENTVMLFGDAKKMISSIVAQLKGTA